MVEHVEESGGYSFRVPVGWETRQQNGITFVMESADAQTFPEQTPEVFALVTSMWLFDFVELGVDIESLAGPADLLDVSLRLQWLVESLQRHTGSEALLEINGYPAYAVTTKDLQGRHEYDILILAQDIGRVAIMEAISSPERWEDTLPIFEAIANSLTLFEPEIEQVDPSLGELELPTREDLGVEPFVNEESGYQIAYPKGWLVLDDQWQVSFSPDAAHSLCEESSGIEWSECHTPIVVAVWIADSDLTMEFDSLDSETDTLDLLMLLAMSQTPGPTYPQGLPLETFDANGLPAMGAQFIGSDYSHDEFQSFRVYIVFVKGQTQAAVIWAMAPTAVWQQVKPVFVAMLDSFAFAGTAGATSPPPTVTPIQPTDTPDTGKPRSAEDLLEQYRAGERDFNDVELEGADLSGAILGRADLSGAILGGADLSGADLSEADLSEADLRGADLSEADLGGADLRGAILYEADLRGATVDDATQLDVEWRHVWSILNEGGAGRDLGGAILGGADLSGSDLSGADLSEAELYWADLSGTDLSGADLSRADLSNADLRGANLSGADLRNADLFMGGLSGADLRGADLSGANLTSAFLMEADLSGADVTGADLTVAVLSRADLSKANLNGANLNGADLSGTNLRGVTLDDATQLDAKWRLVWSILNKGGTESNLSGADLSDADLRGADLRGTDLSGANLDDADLSDADLSGSDLSEADLSWAYLRGATLDGATQLDAKWRLVWSILTEGEAGRDLSGVDLTWADLSGADLSGADLSMADLSHAFLNSANLSKADLSGANLGWAFLFWADLSEADLSGANLKWANLKWADLSGAAVTDEQLAEAGSLEGATLPDGTVHE